MDPGSGLINLGCGTHFHPDWVNLDFVANALGVAQHDLLMPLPFADVSCTAIYTSHVLEHLPHRVVPGLLQECYRILKPGGILRVVVPDLEVVAKLYLQYLDCAFAGDPQAAARYEWITLELLDQMVRDCRGGEMLDYWKQNPMPAEDFVLERSGQEVAEVLKVLRANKGAPQGESAGQNAERSAESIAELQASGELHKWMYDRYSLRMQLQKAGFIKVAKSGAAESRIPNFNSYLLDLNKDGSTRKPDSLFMEGEKP